MNNLEESYKKIFIDCFDISNVNNITEMTKEDIETWDSVSLMLFISMLEKNFFIKIQPDDLFSINSYESGLDIIKKYIQQ